MGGELVTGSSADGDEGGTLSSSFRYGDKFREQCGFYLSIGMSYEDYWDGDCEMARYYRKMFELKQERRNYELWLQGYYFYEALVNASPVFNALSARKTPFPYREMPLPITDSEKEKSDKFEEKKQIENSKNAFMAMVINVNSNLNTRR